MTASCAARPRPNHPVPRKKKKDRALALILALAILGMVSMLALSFMFLVDSSDVTKEIALLELRAKLLAKSAQAEAYLWLKRNPLESETVMFYRDVSGDMLSYKGYHGVYGRQGVVASAPFTVGGNPHQPGTLTLSTVDSLQGTSGAPRWYDTSSIGKYFNVGSTFGYTTINETASPSIQVEVFDDIGSPDPNFDAELNKRWAHNGRFDFLDYGADGVANTHDRGEGNGIHDEGEPSEPFSDFIPNGRRDNFSGALSSRYVELGDSYQIKIQDLSGRIFVNGGEPANPDMPWNYPKVRVLYGADSAGKIYSYETSVVNLPTIKMLNNLGVILSRPPTDRYDPDDPNEVDRWFDEEDRPKGLWVRNDADYEGLPLPIFGPASQDLKQRKIGEHYPQSLYGLGDILVQDDVRPIGGFDSMDQIRRALVDNPKYQTGMTDDHFELLTEFIAIRAWVDDKTIVGAKFRDPDRTGAMRVMEDQLNPYDSDIQIEKTGVLNSRAYSRVFAGGSGSTYGAQITGYAQSNNERSLPLVPGRWDAGFDRDEEKDNFFGFVPERRAPININTASAAVLEAVFTGLEASFVTDRENNLWPMPVPYTDDRTPQQIVQDGYAPPYLMVWAPFQAGDLQYAQSTLYKGIFPQETGYRGIRPASLHYNPAPPNRPLDGYPTWHGETWPVTCYGIDLSALAAESSSWEYRLHWRRINPTIRMTPSVVIYPNEAHELARAIVAYRLGKGKFADFGIDGIRGAPLQGEEWGEGNGKLDYNEEYDYTYAEPGAAVRENDAVFGRITENYSWLSGPQEFTDWEQFFIFLDCVKGRVFQPQLLEDPLLTSEEDKDYPWVMLTDLKADLIFANANPNTQILRFNPNASFASYNRRRFEISTDEVKGGGYESGGQLNHIPRRIDKFDLFTPGVIFVDVNNDGVITWDRSITNANEWVGEIFYDVDSDGVFDPEMGDAFSLGNDLNGNGLYDAGGTPTHTTEFIFQPTGIYDVETLGRIADAAGRDVATKRIRSTVKMFDLLRLTTQRDFEGVCSEDEVDAPPGASSEIMGRWRRDTPAQEIDIQPRLVSYPEFEPQSWLPAYQMHMDGNDPGRPGRVWRWIKKGIPYPGEGGNGTFLKSAAADYDGQLMLPTWQVTEDEFQNRGRDGIAVGGKPNVFALRFYARFGSNFSEGNMGNRENDDLDAVYYDPADWLVHRLKPSAPLSLDGNLAKPKYPWDRDNDTTGNQWIDGENNLWLFQKGLLEPDFWGIGGRGMLRPEIKVGGAPPSYSWPNQRELLTYKKGPTDPYHDISTYDEAQAYKHWPVSIPRYDMEGGLVPDGVYRIGIRNLIYILGSSDWEIYPKQDPNPDLVGYYIPGYEKHIGIGSFGGGQPNTTQWWLKNIFNSQQGEAQAPDKPDHEGISHSLFVTMWIKPAYSGNPARNTIDDDHAEQFIKPHRLPNPAVWALRREHPIDKEGMVYSLESGGPYTLYSEPYPFWSYGPHLWSEQLDVGFNNEESSYIPGGYPTQYIFMPLSGWVYSPSKSEYAPYTFEDKYLPGVGLYDQAAAKPAQMPVWWKLPVNPVPPFPPYFTTGRLLESGPSDGSLGALYPPGDPGDVPWKAQRRYAGPVYTTMPNVLFQFKTFWKPALSPGLDGKILNGWRYVLPYGDYTPPLAYDKGAYSSITLRHAINSPVFEPELDQSRGFGMESDVWTKPDFNTGTHGEMVLQAMRRRRTRTDGPTDWPDMTDWRPMIDWRPTIGYPLVAQLVRYGNVFKNAACKPVREAAPGAVIALRYAGRWLHWTVYEPAATTHAIAPEGRLMKPGEWAKVSYGIKEPVGLQGNIEQGWHKIWVFNSFSRDNINSDLVLSNENDDLGGKLLSPAHGWFINRPFVLRMIRQYKTGDVPPNQMYLWAFRPSASMDQNKYNIEKYLNLEWPNPVGQDPAYIGRLEEINLGPGFAGTIDEFKIYGEIPPEITLPRATDATDDSDFEQAVQGQAGSLESLYPDEYHRYYNQEAGYLSPELQSRGLPDGAAILGMTWSQFIPESLKWSGVPKESSPTYIRISLEVNGSPRVKDLIWPVSPADWPSDIVATHARIRIAMKGEVNNLYQSINPVRGDRLLDTPVLDDIVIRYSLGGTQVLSWEEY